MPTSWYYSNNINQFGEIPQHAQWVDDGTGFYNARFPDGASIGTVLPLLHIANTVVKDIKNKTYYINFTNFNIIDSPSIISGVELELAMNRGGRITDELVQLTYNQQVIGENKANYNLDVNKIYGGANDLWSANLTPDIVADSTFGITLRFQSHPSWPHKSTPMIEYIRIRIY